MGRAVATADSSGSLLGQAADLLSAADLKAAAMPSTVSAGR
ncbi:MAG: hypothetical protein ACOYB7_07850 [Mycobacterium sp.]